jgi:hypothetical protein
MIMYATASVAKAMASVVKAVAFVVKAMASAVKAVASVVKAMASDPVVLAAGHFLSSSFIRCFPSKLGSVKPGPGIAGDIKSRPSVPTAQTGEPVGSPWGLIPRGVRDVRKGLAICKVLTLESRAKV